MAAAIYVALALAIMLAWYAACVHLNHRRSARILQWIAGALGGHGKVTGVRWQGAADFEARLRLLPNSWFQHASICVHLEPRQFPLRWLRARLRREPELITFEADLDSPPASHLEIHRHRWHARTRRNLMSAPQSERRPAVVLATRADWEHEISNTIEWWHGDVQREFLSIRFQPASPHFSATLPLSALAPASTSRGEFIPALQELAGGTSAPHF